MEIIGYENNNFKKLDKLEKLKELWNKNVYNAFHSKEKNINEYKKCYEYICKELRKLYISEEEYNEKYNELRLDCYKSLLYVLESK